jgi:hypothetical protein
VSYRELDHGSEESNSIGQEIDLAPLRVLIIAGWIGVAAVPSADQTHQPARHETMFGVGQRVAESRCHKRLSPSIVKGSRNVAHAFCRACWVAQLLLSPLVSINSQRKVCIVPVRFLGREDGMGFVATLHVPLILKGDPYGIRR